MASGNEMQAMLADLIQNAGSTPAEGAFLQTFAMQSMDTVPGTAAAEGTVQGAELLDGEAEGMQQLYTVLKAAWGGEESSGLMENGFSSLQAGTPSVPPGSSWNSRKRKPSFRWMWKASRPM